MSRPHIEFVQCQRLPRQAEPGALGRAQKRLGQDPDNRPMLPPALAACDASVPEPVGC